MVIDKVLPYWTEEDRQQIKDAEQALKEISRKIDAEYAEVDRAGRSDDYDYIHEHLNDLWMAQEDLYDQRAAIQEAVEQRYIKDHSKQELLADALEIITAIERDDYLNGEERVFLKQAIARAAKTHVDRLRKLFADNYDNCFSFIQSCVHVQFNRFFFINDRESISTLRSAIDKRVSLWYVNPHPAFLTLAHGKATDALAYMSTKDAEIDRITGDAFINKAGVQLAIMKLEELKATLGINTDKLLSTALATFTGQNDFRHTQADQLRRSISIPLKEYASLLGYDVEEHETDTPEAAKKEKRRAKNQLDNARKAIKKDLDIIHASTLAWEEPIRGKVRDFARVSLVTFTGIKNGEIKISFTPELASYLAERNLITQYPAKLLGLDARDPNPYRIGKKLIAYYNIDNNQIRGTQDRISVPSLLSVTDLASYEAVQRKDRGHWQERIKEPLEKALDTLVQEEILANWKYTHAKGKELTDEEAYNITRYEDFATLYVRFTPANTIDHTARVRAKQAARKKADKKADKKK